ncbi:LOW QUALITY PROTEIN: uncharacterized protein C1orf167 homolog [Callospermophilus lateralis]|uniref:LOW QUALITY PROTEIN: uncharacterized protein C1orf167 homolog n=1 Tax=Callospermophilus lateralis TaxID=76772 RepID=UPI0040537CA1
MEPRLVTSYKENVPPGPATPWRPEQRRFLRGLEIGLGHGNGQSVPICQVTRGGPPTTPSPGTALPQEPCRVQSNLASPLPRLGLPLKDTTCWLDTSGFQQQSNLWSLAGRPQGKVRESPVQQKNLRVGGMGSSSLPESHRPRAHLPLCMRQVPGATLAPCPNFRPATGFGPLDGCPRPGPRAWRDLESWTGRLVGEPLTLEDLAVPAQSQARAPPPSATCLLLASVKRLEQEAAGLRCRVSRKPPGHAPWGPRTRCDQAFPARPQPSQPVHASQDEKRRPHGLLETWGVQTPTDPGALSEPESFTTALGTFTGNFCDSEQEVLPAQPPGDKCPSEPPCGWEAMGIPSLAGGTGSSEARLASSAGDTPLGQEGGEQPLREQTDREAERRASCPSDATSARRRGRQSEALNGVTLEPQAARWQRLSRCFRAWRHLAWRRWAVTSAVALSRRRLLRRGLQALRWALWLREAQLEAAWGRHTKALLARSFREWRCLALRQEQGHPNVQSVSRPPCHSPSLGRVAVVDPAQSPGRQRQEEGARPRPLRPGQRADDGDGRVQVLQALQQLAVSLLQYHLKDRTRQERAVLEEAPGAPQRTRRMASPPQAWHPSAAGASVTSQPQRAWLPRCSGAWQQLAPRGAQVQNHPADHRLETLRVCLGRWVQMKQLRASEGTKVTRLSLCLKKAAPSLRACGRGPGGTAPRTPVLLEPLRVSFLWAAGRRRQRQSLLLWWARAQQSRGAARWCQRSLQRRILLSWSHWTTAQGARRELAAHRAWERSCRTALGLWRQRLAQWQKAEQRNQERGRGLAQEALRCWHSCRQRQQVLHEKYQRWVQGHLRGLRRAMFQGWWQAAARRRHKQRVLKAWAQSAAQGHVQQAAVTQLQQAGLRHLLWTHWAQWQTALLRLGTLASAHSCRIPEEQPQSHGSALFWSWRGPDAPGHKEEVPAVLAPKGSASQVPGFRNARSLAVIWRSWADARRGQQLSQALAFEKWHQCLVVRRQRRGATSSLSPLTGQAPGP